MTPTPRSHVYRHVLVGTDGSATASRAVESAARLAHAHAARLTIANAFGATPSQGDDPATIPAHLHWLRSPVTIADAIARAAADLAQAAACGGLEIEVRTEVGSPRSVMQALMVELEPDVVVVGDAHRRRSIAWRGLGTALAQRTTADVVIIDASDPSVGRRRRRPAA